MMPVKLFGCAAVALSGLALGFMKSKSLYQRRDFLKRCLVFMNSLQTILRYNGDEISRAVTSAAKNSGLNFLCFESDSNTPFEPRWINAVNSIPRQFSLNNSDKELLLAFGERLGKTDVEGQLSHISLYCDLLQKQIAKAGEDAEKKSRLFKALGIFGGASAAILIY